MALGIAAVHRKSFEIVGGIRVVGCPDPCFVARVVEVYFREGHATPIPPELLRALHERAWSAEQIGRILSAIEPRPGK
jgi:hypothetical protein